MRGLRLTSFGLLSLWCLGGQALAQQAPSVVGTWSSQQPGAEGIARATLGMGSDGTYAIESQLPNGSRLRIWGTYQATQISETEIRVVPQIADWRPHTICTQAPGFSPNCSPFQPPPAQPQVFTFTGPDAYTVDGNEWERDPTAGLLQMPVADPYMQYAQAPVQPIIPQPVAPSPPSGYPTPVDPRTQYEQGNSAFLNGYMRGCTMIDGQWRDCSQ